MSHLTGVRGLKHCTATPEGREVTVAPYRGAWIETKQSGIEKNTESSRTLQGCVD